MTGVWSRGFRLFIKMNMFKIRNQVAACLVCASCIGGAQATPATAIDLGTLTLANSPINVSVPTYAAATIRWYKFTFAGDVSSTAFTFLDIFSSDAGAGDLDTELGIYTSTGVKVSDDDDDGDGYYSMLSFGIGGGGNGSGQDGSTLVAGTYYIATGRYDTIFNATGFSVTSSGPANASPYNLTLRRGSNAPIPPQYITGSLNLDDTTGPFAVNRLMRFTVKQGTTSIGSAEILTSYASTPFIIEVPASATGAATLEWDGASFLRNSLNITLSGTQTVAGPMVLSNGDVDNSGEVDAGDIDVVIANFGQAFPGGIGNPFSDVDCSGEVDATDIDIVIANFGRTDN